MLFRLPALARCPPPVGRAVRACGTVVRAGWIAWQTIVSGGRRPVGPEGEVELESG